MNNTYIGRFNPLIGHSSIWANPFKLTKDDKHCRLEVIMKYTNMIITNEILSNNLHELLGQTLGCWCKPKLCHGEVLIKMLKDSIIWLDDS